MTGRAGEPEFQPAEPLLAYTRMECRAWLGDKAVTGRKHIFFKQVPDPIFSPGFLITDKYKGRRKGFSCLCQLIARGEDRCTAAFHIA